MTIIPIIGTLRADPDDGGAWWELTPTGTLTLVTLTDEYEASEMVTITGITACTCRDTSFSYDVTIYTLAGAFLVTCESWGVAHNLNDALSRHLGGEPA